MNAQNLIWKRRYERLKQFMADAEFDIRKEGFEKSESRCWDAPDEVFVSFAFDVCDTEATAIKVYGEGNYDVYQLKRKGKE